MWNAAQAELLSPRIQGKAEGTVSDVLLCLPVEGKVTTQALKGVGDEHGNCHLALRHVLCVLSVWHD